AQHELNIVLVDQTFHELGGASRRRLVVVIFYSEIVAFAADLDAAGVVDFLDREFVAVSGIRTVGRVDAGRRKSGAEDQVFTCLRLSGCRRIAERGHCQHGRKPCAVEHWLFLPKYRMSSPAWLTPELKYKYSATIRRVRGKNSGSQVERTSQYAGETAGPFYAGSENTTPPMIATYP